MFQEILSLIARLQAPPGDRFRQSTTALRLDEGKAAKFLRYEAGDPTLRLRTGLRSILVARAPSDGKIAARDLGIRGVSADSVPSGRHRDLREAMRRFDARMRVLGDLGIDLSRPGRELLEDLRERKEERRRQYEELEETQREADWLLLPELLDLHVSGSDADRRCVGSAARMPQFSVGVRLGSVHPDRDRR